MFFNILWCFPKWLILFFWFFWGFLKWGPRTYSNIFWIIFRTSTMFTKSGPLHPRFITKTLYELQDKSPNMFKHIICTYINISKKQKNRKYRKLSDIKRWTVFLVSVLFLWVQNNWRTPALSKKKGILHWCNLNMFGKLEISKHK